MIHSYDDDEVVSTHEIIQHQRGCRISGTTVDPYWNLKCTCTPIRGTRIVIEKWDEYPVKAKESK